MNKKEPPIIKTERLILRPFTLDDAPEIQRLAGDKDVASTTSDGEIPQPNMAEQWIKVRQERVDRGESVEFAVIHTKRRVLIGIIHLSIQYKQDESMELGYWIGKPYWNQGYCTEAARAVLKYGFEILGLHRIFARHFARNPASGRILEKIGMIHEGTLREAFKKWSRFEDMEVYGILKSDYDEE